MWLKVKYLNIANLASIRVLTAVENNIPSVSNLFKLLTITQKLMQLKRKLLIIYHDKDITIPEFNKCTKEILDLRLKQVSLASKSDITNFVNETNIDNKLKDATPNKNELNELSKKLTQYQQKA